jgi:hypothetical protein
LRDANDFRDRTYSKLLDQVHPVRIDGPAADRELRSYFPAGQPGGGCLQNLTLTWCK